MKTLNIKRFLSATLLLLGFATATFAQKTKVILYKDMLAAKFDTVNCVKNAIKINPLLFLVGEIPIYYERAITHKLSIELGVGVTLRNYVNLNIGNDVDDLGAGTEVLPNLALHAAGRYYLTNDIEPHGWYVGPEFAHRTYTKDIREKDPDGVLSDRRLRDLRVFDELKVITGFQNLSSSSNWLIDIYAGLGARNRHIERVKETNLFGSWSYEVEKIDDIVPSFYLGFKIGMGF